MATQAQISANRRNAQKSTGPRSAKGRARSAQNRKSHGLSAQPPQARVQAWYGAITGQASFPLEGEVDPAAYALAMAEARLESALQEEMDPLKEAQECGWQKIKIFHGPEMQIISENLYLAIIDPEKADPKLIYGTMTREEFPLYRDVVKMLVNTDPGDPKYIAKRSKLMRRYRKAAEAERERAFDHWMKLVSNPKTNPITP